MSVFFFGNNRKYSPRSKKTVLLVVPSLEAYRSSALITEDEWRWVGLVKLSNLGHDLSNLPYTMHLKFNLETKQSLDYRFSDTPVSRAWFCLSFQYFMVQLLDPHWIELCMEIYTLLIFLLYITVWREVRPIYTDVLLWFWKLLAFISTIPGRWR